MQGQSTRYAVKALQSIKNLKFANSVYDLPPTVTSALPLHPQNEQLFNALLELKIKNPEMGFVSDQPEVNQEEGTVDVLRDSLSQRDDMQKEIAGGRNQKTGFTLQVKEDRKITLNIPKSRENSQRISERTLEKLSPDIQSFAKFRDYLIDKLNKGEVPDEVHKFNIMADDIRDGTYLAAFKRYGKNYFATFEEVLDEIAENIQFIPKEELDKPVHNKSDQRLFSYCAQFIGGLGRPKAEEITPEDEANRKSFLSDILHDVEEANLNPEKAVAELKAYLDEIKSKKEEDKIANDDASDPDSVAAIENLAKKRNNSDYDFMLRQWKGLNPEQKQHVYNYLKYFHIKSLNPSAERKRLRIAAQQKVFDMMGKVTQLFASKNTESREELVEKIAKNRQAYLFAPHVQYFKTNSQGSDLQTMIFDQIEVLSKMNMEKEPEETMKELTKIERLIQYQLQYHLDPSKKVPLPDELKPYATASFHDKLNFLYEHLVTKKKNPLAFEKHVQSLQNDTNLPNQGRILNTTLLENGHKDLFIENLKIHVKEELGKYNAIMQAYYQAQMRQAEKSDFAEEHRLLCELQTLKLKMVERSSSVEEYHKLQTRLLELEYNALFKRQEALQQKVGQLQPALELLHQISQIEFSIKKQHAQELSKLLFEYEEQFIYFNGSATTAQEASIELFGKSIFNLTDAEGLTNSLRNRVEYSKQVKEHAIQLVEKYAQIQKDINAQVQPLLPKDDAGKKQLLQTLKSYSVGELESKVKPLYATYVQYLNQLFEREYAIMKEGLIKILDKEILTDEQIEQKSKQYQEDREYQLFSNKVVERIKERGFAAGLLNMDNINDFIAYAKANNVPLELKYGKDYLENDPLKKYVPNYTLIVKNTTGFLQKNHRYKRDRHVKLIVKVSELKISEEAKKRLKAIAGVRYNKDNDKVTLSCQIFPEKEQNSTYLRQLLIELVKEANKADTDPRYQIAEKEEVRVSNLQNLQQRYQSFDEEEKQSLNALANWRNLKRSGKLVIGADLTYGEGITEKDLFKSKKKKGVTDDLGYGRMGEEDEDEDEELYSQAAKLE